MQTATHFIEIFRDYNGKQFRGVLSEVKDLQRNLNITKKSEKLKTLAVIMITPKPGVIIPSPEQTEL